MSDTAPPDALALFDYALPREMIAQVPAEPREASRLLVVPRRGPLADRCFADLPDLLRPGDLLVANDTRVLPARLLGRRAGGGRSPCCVRWAPRGDGSCGSA